MGVRKRVKLCGECFRIRRDQKTCCGQEMCGCGYCKAVIDMIRSDWGLSYSFTNWSPAGGATFDKDSKKCQICGVRNKNRLHYITHFDMPWHWSAAEAWVSCPVCCMGISVYEDHRWCSTHSHADDEIEQAWALHVLGRPGMPSYSSACHVRLSEF